MAINYHQQNEMLRSIVESMADGVIVLDKQGRLILVNEAARRMNLPHLIPGFPMGEQALRANIRDTSGHPLAPDEIPIIRALRGETLPSMEIVITRPDGSDAYLSVSTSPLRDKKGNIVGAIGIFRDITERKTYEERMASLLRQVEAQQELTQTVVENVPAEIIYIDADFNCLWLNERAAKLLGKRREDIAGKNLFAAVPGSEEQLGSVTRQVAASGETQSFNEWRYVLPNGKDVFLDVSFVPLVEEGRTAGVLIMGVDVTQEVEGRREAEEIALNWKRLADAAHTVLQERSLEKVAQKVVELANQIVGSSKSALWLAEPESRRLPLIAYRNLSPETVEIFSKYTYETPSMVVHAAITGQLQEIEDMLTLGPEYATSVRTATMEGVRSLIAIPLWAGGELVGIVSLAREEPYRLTPLDRETVDSLAGIFASALLNARLYEETAQLVRQAQQRASELETTLTSITDPIFVVDVDGRVKTLNEAARKFFRGVTTHAEGEKAADIATSMKASHLNGEPFLRDELAISRALRGEVVTDMDVVTTDPSSGRETYLVVSAAPIRDEDGKVAGAVTVLRDVTRIRQAEFLRDEFLSTAAHELKTPVTVLKGYSQALLRSPEALPPKFARALEAIDRQSTKINRLVGDLLDITRLMAGHMEMRLEALNLADLVREVVDRMALTVTRHRLNLAADAQPVVRGDRDRLEQVIINLLDNAIKYSPQGGDVDTRVYEQDGNAVVSVTDHGIGIPKEKQSHIFERFYRAHAGTPYDYGGMGVGLYITKEIVERHGGHVWFVSEEGKGSTFYFSLPLV